MRIGVAATAPIGADVLERLAESHEIAFLLTRPDAPQGRGRRVAPPPAKLVADQLGIPVHQPEKPELPAEVDRMVVCAYGLYIPPRLLERTLWMNVHPVPAAALARRRAGRARDPRRRRADRRDDPRDGRGARRRTGGGAARRSTSATSTRGRSSRARPRSRPVCSTRCIESPDVRAPGRGRRDVRREDRPRRPRARPRRPRGRVAPRPRALAAHRRVGDAARPARDGLEGAARGRRVRPRGRPAGGTQPDELRRVPPRRPMIAPARRAAFDVVRRVFEEDAYADRALASAVEGLDERDRALAQRLAYGTVQRTRTIDFGIEQARQAARAQARSARPRGAAGRRLPARVDRPGRARRRRRRGRARARREARARRPVHERGHAPARAVVQRPRRVAARRAGQALVSRLDLRRLAARLRPRRRAVADARAERAARSSRCAPTSPSASRPTSPARTSSNASTPRACGR